MYGTLRALMRLNNINQRDLAKITGVSISAISARKTGKQEWRLNECYLILDALGRNPEDLNVVFPSNKW